MLPEDRQLLADLKRVCNDAGQFVLQYLAGDLTTAAEEAYAHRLIDIGERLLNHANNRKQLVLDGEPMPIIIDAGSAPAEFIHEPPPASLPSSRA